MKKMNKLLIFAMMFLCTIGVASAYSVVTGTIYDASHAPVNAATVTVTCNTNVETTTSNSLGLYIVDFVDSTCPFDTAVHVDATKDAMSGSNNGFTCASAEDCAIPVALIDVTIPEFTMIAVGLAMVGGVLGFVVLRRNK
jgi:hypothetical protein